VPLHSPLQVAAGLGCRNKTVYGGLDSTKRLSRGLTSIKRKEWARLRRQLRQVQQERDTLARLRTGLPVAAMRLRRGLRPRDGKGHKKLRKR